MKLIAFMVFETQKKMLRGSQPNCKFAEMSGFSNGLLAQLGFFKSRLSQKLVVSNNLLPIFNFKKEIIQSFEIEFSSAPQLSSAKTFPQLSSAHFVFQNLQL